MPLSRGVQRKCGRKEKHTNPYVTHPKQVSLCVGVHINKKHMCNTFWTYYHRSNVKKNTVWACVTTVCKVTSAAHIRWIYSFFVIYIQCQFFSTPAPEKRASLLSSCQRPEVILLRPRKFTCSLFTKRRMYVHVLLFFSCQDYKLPRRLPHFKKILQLWFHDPVITEQILCIYELVLAGPDSCIF